MANGKYQRISSNLLCVIFPFRPKKLPGRGDKAVGVGVTGSPAEARYRYYFLGVVVSDTLLRNFD